MKGPAYTKLSLEVHTFNEKRKHVPLLNRKEVKQVLEALEQIRKAEEENEKRAQTLRQQLKIYATEKEQELETIQTNYRQQLKQLVEEKEQFEIQELEKKK